MRSKSGFASAFLFWKGIKRINTNKGSVRGNGKPFFFCLSGSVRR
jgi:hypothetical protein